MTRTPLLVLAALTLATPARAQIPPRPFDAASPSLSLSLRSVELDLGEVSALDSPIVRDRAISLVVQSTTRWRMTVRAQDDFRGAAPSPVAAEHFQLRIPGGAYVPMSRIQPVSFATGPPTSNAGDVVDADAKVDVGWGDPPGTYGATLLFTLMAEP